MQKTMLKKLKEELLADNVRPRWVKLEPMCGDDDCPSYDGKRCSKRGFRPSAHCDVAVAVMAKALASRVA